MQTTVGNTTVVFLLEEYMTRIYCTLERITFKAYYVTTKNNKNKLVSIWLPKSQVKATDCLAAGDKGYMDIPEWLAKKNDLEVKSDDDCPFVGE